MKEQEYEKLTDEIRIAQTYYKRAEEYVYMANQRMDTIENMLIDLRYGETI